MTIDLRWPWTDAELEAWEAQPCVICGQSPVTLETRRDVYCEKHGPDDKGSFDD